jgi:hypothetical protein
MGATRGSAEIVDALAALGVVHTWIKRINGMLREIWFEKGSGRQITVVHWKGNAVVVIGGGCAALGVAGYGFFQSTRPVLAVWCLGFVAAVAATAILVIFLHSGPEEG